MGTKQSKGPNVAHSVLPLGEALSRSPPPPSPAPTYLALRLDRPDARVETLVLFAYSHVSV